MSWEVLFLLLYCGRCIEWAFFFFFLECLVGFFSGTLHFTSVNVPSTLEKKSCFTLFDALYFIWFHALHHILPVPLETPCTRAVYGETEERFWGFGLPFVLYLRQYTATSSSMLAWRISRAEESGELQSMGLPRVRHDWASNTLSKRISENSMPLLPFSSSILLLRVIPSVHSWWWNGISITLVKAYS